MAGTVAIGIDAGGTKVNGLLVDTASGEILDRRLALTPAQEPDAAVRTIIAVACDLSVDGRGEAVGIGAAGLVDFAGTMRFAPNVAWRDMRLGDRIREGVKLPVLVDNDANVAAWGEFRFGAGRGVDEMLLVTVGTGIGGGIVSRGRLFRGAHGFAGEFGHTIVEPGGPLCGCGNRGCWEQVASGRAIGRLGAQAVREHPEGALARHVGGDPSLVTGLVVTEVAQSGDPVAVGILEEVGRRLGEGLAGVVNVLDPELAVVGGGAAGAGELLLGPARRAFARSVEGRQHRPEVPLVPAALGNDAGALGAADLALMAVRDGSRDLRATEGRA